MDPSSNPCPPDSHHLGPFVDGFACLFGILPGLRSVVGKQINRHGGGEGGRKEEGGGRKDEEGGGGTHRTIRTHFQEMHQAIQVMVAVGWYAAFVMSSAPSPPIQAPRFGDQSRPILNGRVKVAALGVEGSHLGE